MSEPTGKSPESSRRNDRRAQALRENLKRRKAQARGRARTGGPETAENETAEPRVSGASSRQTGRSPQD